MRKAMQALALVAALCGMVASGLFAWDVAACMYALACFCKLSLIEERFRG